MPDYGDLGSEQDAAAFRAIADQTGIPEPFVPSARTMRVMATFEGSIESLASSMAATSEDVDRLAARARATADREVE